MTAPTRRAALAGVATLAATAASRPARANAAIDGRDAPQQVIEPWRPRFGRARPVVAVVASSAGAGTELTDFVIPFGVLSASGAAEVVAVAAASGIVPMYPALRLDIRTSLAEFDRRYPEGADYVVVPGLAEENDSVLLDWLRAQAAREATIASICIGAHVVAAAGLMDGRRAASWWGSEAPRITRFPNVRWEKNIRYVVDGRIVSSAGISASLPTSLALVAAIAGRARADALAAEIGVADWGSRHDSDAFQPRPDLPMPSRVPLSERDIVGLPVTPGVDEVALALTAEPYSNNGRSQAVAYAESAALVRTRHGLLIVPERMPGGEGRLTRMLPPIPDGPSAKALDAALLAIAAEYGRPAAAQSARIMEYPGFGA